MLLTHEHESIIYRKVLAHINKHTPDPKRTRPNQVVLLDIDDTSLITTVSLEHLYRQYVTYRIYRYAVERGVPVIFLTARRSSCFSYLWTLHQLYALGYTTMRKLVLMPRACKSVAAFKASVREKIGTDNILVNMGDQWGDFFHPITSGVKKENGIFMFVDPNHTRTMNVKLPSY
jgi:hypothetical protein